MIAMDKGLRRFNVLLLDFNIKENCPEIRNTRVIDIYRGLISCSVNVYGPWADISKREINHNITLV